MKLKISKYWLAIMFAVGLMLLVALIDKILYPTAFHIFAIGLSVAVGGAYYIFTRDLSESLAIPVVFTLFYIGGLEDLLFYLTSPLAIPAVMPHLNTHFIIGPISRLFGFADVTFLSIMISVAIFGAISYAVARVLLKIEWK